MPATPDARAPVITPNIFPKGRDLYETFPQETAAVWQRGRALTSPDARAPGITSAQSGTRGEPLDSSGHFRTDIFSKGREPFTTAPDARAPTGLHVQGYLAHKTRDDGRDAVMTAARTPVITPSSLSRGGDLYETFPRGRESFSTAPDARETFIATSPFPGGREAFLTPRKQPGYEAGYR